MGMKLLFLCCVILLLTCACAANPASQAPAASRVESLASSSEAVITPEQALHDAYFATEHRWLQTKISGDSLEQTLPSGPYAYNLCYLYFLQEGGLVTRAIAKRDPTLGNWREQEAEQITVALEAITEVATLDGQVVSQEDGRPFFVEAEKRIIDTDVNCQDKKVYYESDETISQLQVGKDVLFFLENETTLCRLHRASGIVDKWELPTEKVNRYIVITDGAVVWTSNTAEFAKMIENGEDIENLIASFKKENKFLLDCKSGENRELAAKDYDEHGLLIYE